MQRTLLTSSATQTRVETPLHKELRASRSRFDVLREMPILIKLCVMILFLFVLVGGLAPILAPHSPTKQILVARLTPPIGAATGSWTRPFGTDQLGRDILSRLIYGTRISLSIGLFGMVFGLILGTSIGLISGFVGGIIDDVLMFLVDTQLAIPYIIVALTGLAIFGTNLIVLMLLVGIAGWESYARLARGMVLSARGYPYILSAYSIGASRGRVLLRHILPNIVAPLIVLATFQLTSIILLESSLSFLGIGVQPPTASWGSMVGAGRDYLNTAWWIAVFPGLAIIIVTMAVSLFGDWLRDALDPTLRSR
ncbi:MAG: ABC transporter permease [Nitrolancea sp.]